MYIHYISIYGGICIIDSAESKIGALCRRVEKMIANIIFCGFISTIIESSIQILFGNSFQGFDKLRFALKGVNTCDDIDKR